jgi:hypothetical protein
MNNAIKGMTGKNIFQSGQIPKVRFIEGYFFSRYFLYAFHRRNGAVNQIVRNYHRISLFQKRYAGMASNVTCAPGYQNGHTIISIH